MIKVDVTVTVEGSVHKISYEEARALYADLQELFDPSTVGAAFSIYEEATHGGTKQPIAVPGQKGQGATAAGINNLPGQVHDEPMPNTITNDVTDYDEPIVPEIVIDDEAEDEIKDRIEKMKSMIDDINKK